VGGIETSLDKVLALGLGDKGLELGGSEGVDQAGLGDDEEQDLCARKCRKFVCLQHTVSRGFDGLGKVVTFFIMPVNRHVRRGRLRHHSDQHTCFPFGERYMTSRFILDEFDLDLSSSSLLIRLGLLLVLVFISATVHRVAVLYEYIFPNRWRAGWWWWVAIGGRLVRTLAFAAHIG
jgi:hypothetical protein